MLIGFFKTLGAATKAVQEIHQDFKGIETLELTEYASTFEPNFNVQLYDEEEQDYLEIYGYIVPEEALIKAIKEAK